MKIVIVLMLLITVTKNAYSEVGVVGEADRENIIRLSPLNPNPRRSASTYSKHHSCVADLVPRQQFCRNNVNYNGACTSGGKSVTLWHENDRRGGTKLYTLTDSGLSMTQFQIQKEGPNLEDIASLRVRIPSEVPGDLFLYLHYHSPMQGFQNGGIQHALTTPAKAPGFTFTPINLENFVSPTDAQGAISRFVVRKLQDRHYTIKKYGGELTDDFKQTLCHCMLNDEKIKIEIEKFHEFDWKSDECFVS